MIAPTKLLSRIYRDKASKDSGLSKSLTDFQPFNYWLLHLDKDTLLKSFIYYGYTENSYLEMTWDDYINNRAGFILQWDHVLQHYYQYSIARR